MKLYRITFKPRGLECYVVEDDLAQAVDRALSRLSAGDTVLVKGLVVEILTPDMDHVILDALDEKRKLGGEPIKSPGGESDAT